MKLLLKKAGGMLCGLRRAGHGRTVVAVLAAMIVLGTAGALILPAKTMDVDTAGKEPGVSLEQETGQISAAGTEMAAEAKSEPSDDKALTNKKADKKEGESQAEGNREESEKGEDKTAAGEKTYRDSKIAITASYSAKAHIPGNAVLKAVKLDAQNNDSGAESYLYNIGFHVGDKEIEPEGTVSLKVQFLDGKFADAEGIRVIHYLDSGDADRVTDDMKTETIKTETSTAKDGSVQTEFDMDSFSLVEFEAIGGAETYAISGSNTVEVGSTIELTSDKRYSNHKWKSSDNTIAAVTGNSRKAVVTGVRAGNVTITHTYWGLSAGSETFTVTVTEATGERTVTFDGNGGSGNVASITAEVGKDIEFPKNGFRNGNKVFVGWSTNPNASSGSAQSDHRSAIYKPGETYRVTDKETFYAIWAEKNVDATFYIRLDGLIPTEPAPADTSVSYEASDYTRGVTIDDVLKEAKFYADTGGVNDNLNSVPSNEQIVKMINDNSRLDNGKTRNEVLGFQVAIQNGKIVVTSISDPSANAVQKLRLKEGDEVYVLWYVVKNASPGPVLEGNEQTWWHVDGTLLVRSKVSLVYDANAPAVDTMPVGTQWEKDSTVKAGTTDTGNKVIVTPSRSDGYIFTGWKKYTKDSDGNYTVTDGTIYQPGEEFTITEDTQLVAQWAKDRAELIVRKTDESGNLIDTATFTLNATSKQTKDGVANFDSIELNTVYALSETTAPEGFEKREGTVYFEEVQNGSSYAVKYYTDAERTNIADKPEWLTESFSGSNLTLTVSNVRSKADIKIRKIETGTSIRLPGAVFELYRSDDTKVQNITTGEDGEVIVERLPIGEYYLKETKAPDGYNLLSDTIHFSVGADKITLHSTGNASAEGFTLTVSNSAGVELPKTGGTGTLPYTFGGLLILTVGLMYGYRLMRRRGRRTS